MGVHETKELDHHQPSPTSPIIEFSSQKWGITSKSRCTSKYIYPDVWPTSECHFYRAQDLSQPCRHWTRPYMELWRCHLWFALDMGWVPMWCRFLYLPMHSWDPSTCLESWKYSKHSSPLDFQQTHLLADHYPTFPALLAHHPMLVQILNQNAYQGHNPHSKWPLITLLPLSWLAHMVRPMANVHLDPCIPEHNLPDLRLRSRQWGQFLGRLATSLCQYYLKV